MSKDSTLSTKISTTSNTTPLPPSSRTNEGGIEELLLSAIKLVNKLHLSLQDEHRALSSNNLNAFERAVEQKIAHTSELETTEKSIFSLLNYSGFKMDKDGIASYIATLKVKSDRKTIRTLWKKMSEALVECQQQNQVNGRILNLASVNMRQALEILTGQRGAPKPNPPGVKQSKKTIAIA